MAREFVGLDVRMKDGILYAPLLVTLDRCTRDPTLCCEPDDVDNCCPEGERVQEIIGAFSGPIGLDGEVCTNTWTLALEAGSIPVWSGISQATLTGGCAYAQVAARIWCSNTGTNPSDWRWFVSGLWVDPDGNPVTFGPVPMDDNCDTLTVSVAVFGQDEPLDLVFERPCPIPHSYNCVDGNCQPVCGVNGRYATLAACQAQCALGGVAECCVVDRPAGLNRVLFLTLTGEGTLEMTWDDAYYWIGSKELSCGETLHVRFSVNCGMEFSCNGESWIVANSVIPVPDPSTCKPMFDWRVTFNFDMDSAGIGCNTTGGCGLITGTPLKE